jgi:hypothetical protein
MTHFRLTFIILFFASRFSYGQNDVSAVNGQFKTSIHPLSPQAADFVQYGNSPVSYFTGGVDLKIPLYTYKDNDFELPVFVGYSSSGFIPNKRDGIVGLNWFLSAGGVITRTIKGVADDRQGSGTNMNPMLEHGLLYGIKNNLGVKSLSKADLFTTVSGDISSGYVWSIGGCELQPDEFTLSMPGYSGKFFLQNDGTVRVEGNKPFKVDLSGVSVQTYNNYYDIYNSEIIITTDDGYKYYFGGTIQFLEYSVVLFHNSPTVPPEINGWHLTKIEAPNGRTATFQYVTFSPMEQSFHRSNSNHFLVSLAKSQVGQSSSYTNGTGGLVHVDISSSSGESSILETTKTVYLKSITVDQKVIEFTYSGKTQDFYNDAVLDADHGLKLDNITVKDGTTSLYTYQFGYDYLKNGKRLFLTSLAESGKNPYVFDYYLPANDFPSPQTVGIDYWGFWNGGTSEYGRLIPMANVESNGDLTYTSNEREPNIALAAIGLLKTITYPTNGYSMFEYEAHTYSKRLERRNSSNFLAQLFDVSGYAGGARIAKVTDYDGVTASRVREFKYARDYVTGGTTSSGILLNWPRYLYYWKWVNGSQVQQRLMMKSTSYHVNHDPGESHMQYGEVTEVISPGNGCMTYKFTNYETNPDVNDYHTAVVIPETQQYIQNLALYNNYIGINMNGRSFERGQLKEVTAYAYKNNVYYPVTKTITDYTNYLNYPDSYVTEVHQTGGIVQSTKQYYYPFLPVKRTSITYSGQGQQSVSSVTDLTYTIHNYPLTSITSQSDGKPLKTKYKYVSDYVSAGLTTYYQNAGNYNSLAPEVRSLVNMYENNMLKYPVEVIQYVDDKATTASFITYQDLGNAYKSKLDYPYQQWGLKTSAGLSAFNESAVVENTWALTKDSHYGTTPDIVLQKYDSKGNVIEQTDISGVTTAILWGYNFTHPVAEIKNATYQDVLGVLTQTVVDGLNSSPGTDAQVRQQLQALRSAASLSNARITTYTYTPLVGLSSVTDVNGFTSYYQYDAYNRLKLIIDKDQNILKRYEYNYQAR